MAMYGFIVLIQIIIEEIHYVELGIILQNCQLSFILIQNVFISTNSLPELMLIFCKIIKIYLNKVL